MIYNSKWVFPAMRKSTKVWNYASSVTIVAFGLFTKLLICLLNKQRVYNKDVFINAIKYRPNNVPLITVSNHHSCFDDPGIWASLPLNEVFSPSRFRWILAAHDIVFTNYFHSLIFALGKCVPTIRGAGVYQDAVDFCIEKLNIGEWIHVFPEGKVNMTKENLRLKWGVGRLIFESNITPIVIPIWHLGMDELLPNYPPYRFRLRKKLTFNFGQPIDFTEILRKIRETNLNAMEARKFITDKIQSELNKLKIETEMLHKFSVGL